MKIFRNSSRISVLCLSVLLWGFPAHSHGQEFVVLDSIDEIAAWLDSEEWWGDESHDAELVAPHTLLTFYTPRWREIGVQLPVATKKELFYRLILPLIMHANSLVLQGREQLHDMRGRVADGASLTARELEDLRQLAVRLRIIPVEAAPELGQSDPELLKVIDQSLYKFDVIPAGLVLGQAAYESGYGTSRFAVEGNALFGQWTYGGEGMLPEQQRKELGDHRIASYEWPFDSVRSYFYNLCAHPAYEDFRRLRAQKRAANLPLRSLELADGLLAYSERGQEYVDTLKGIIRVNNLAVADLAVFRDEPVRFLIAADQGQAAATRVEIESLRESGELQVHIQRMALD